jgi:hypothetical protein
MSLSPETSPVECAAGANEIELQPLRTLCDMLTYRRVSGSRTEGKFIRRYLMPLGAKPDSFGNYVLRIGDSPVLFSSHTDSVHRTAGRQRLLYKNGKLTVKHPKATSKEEKKTVEYYDKSGQKHIWEYMVSSRGQCLGADDAVGCWIMREMAQARVPGLYVWHRQEESGGIGSSYIADTTPELVRGIEAAIAFDRRGNHDVITHQAAGRCASDIFAESLAALLPGTYRPSSGGIFTDTANYTDLIGECTNISVGYYDEHTSSESLDLAHALRVRDAMLAFDYSKLELRRFPGEKDRTPRYYGRYGGFEEDSKTYYRDRHAKANYPGYSAWTGDNQDPWDDAEPESHTVTDFDRMVELVRLNPNEIADMLCEYGMDAKGLREELYNRGASLHRI